MDPIQRIRESVDIVDVISEYVELHQDGKRYLGCCPFHDERTPSFSVDPAKGVYYCFGCHAGGDAFTFLAALHGEGFKQAARRLGRRMGIDVAPETRQEKDKHEAIARALEANKRDFEAFRSALGTPEGAMAREYLVMRRVNKKLADHWGIGYGVGSRLFDGRVVLPIYDDAGRLTGFGGRKTSTDKEGPKYVNSVESVLFAKRKLLYGWPQAEVSIRKLKQVIVVEGYFDVIACHRAGLTNVVATLGTSLSEHQAAQCKRIANEVVLLMDGDKAGRIGAHNAAIAALGSDLNVKLAQLPEGHDPDAFVGAFGADAIRDLVFESGYAIDVLLSRAMPTAEDKAAAVRSIWPLVSALGDSLERDLYVSRIADRVGIAVDDLIRHMTKESSKK